MDRAEYVKWCKERALKYLDENDTIGAMASMISDMNKREDTRIHPALIPFSIKYLVNDDVKDIRRFIEGFN